MGIRIRHQLRLWVYAPLAVLYVVCITVLAAPSALAAPFSTQTNCQGPVAGQYIYDCAGLLTPTEVASLQQDAAAVVKQGAPTVVYLQVKDATAQEAFRDAADLMNRWNVESKPGARDGFVMLFDLQPGNLRHGQVALFAGAKHYQHGNLPQSELDHIRTEIMTPLLAEGQTAAGIAAGLQQVAHDLRYGLPPPSAAQVAAQHVGRLPFNGLALFYALVVGFLLWRVRRQPPLSTAADEVGGMSALPAPGDLAPGIVGALLRGRVADTHIEATVLDFARRGLLVLEPESSGLAHLRMVGSFTSLQGFELDVWEGLVSRTAKKSRIVTSSKLAQFRQAWPTMKRALQRELTERGWYDPEAAHRRRVPLYVAAGVGMAGMFAAIVLSALAQEAWPLIGGALFTLAAVVAFVGAYRVANTTVEGEIAAAPWRAYRESVIDHAYQPNLDTDLPYIVALGILGKLASRLKAASEKGYAPSWFIPETAGRRKKQASWNTTGMGFYPYWIAFHTGSVPVPSSGRYSGGSFGGGSFGGGFGGGGAAGGGGGSAGGF